MGKRRVLIIGLDGATLDLLEPWAASGRLPTFKRIMERGITGVLTSTIPPVTGPAWSSFITGKNPGKHGIFAFMKRKQDSYDFYPVTAEERKGKAVWDLLGEKRKKVVIINVPVTYPPQAVNGLMITGMLTPHRASRYTHPDSLAGEIKKRVGDYLVFPQEVYAKGKVEAFLKEIYRVTERRKEVALYLMRERPWDFFMVVFNGSDVIQHGLWHCMDPEHPQYDPEENRRYGDAILNYYERIDGILGEMWAEVGEDTVLMIMSDHGAGPLYRLLHTNNFLMELGLLKLKGEPLTRIKHALFRVGLTPKNVYDLLQMMGWGRLRRTLDKRREGYGLLRRYFLSFADIDWPRTRAYSLGGPGQIYINLKWREPSGAVEPGMEYKSLRDEIVDRLWRWEDPESGEKIVGEIFRKEEIYQGEYLAEAPDILFFPRGLESISLGSFVFSSNCLMEPPFAISGHHRMEGLFLAAGPMIREGARLQSREIIDLAPTILYLFGVPIPVDMDGQIIEGAFEKGYLEAHPPEYVQASIDEEVGEGGWREGEGEEIEERLRGLGYI